jgi:hypothetical protein
LFQVKELWLIKTKLFSAGPKGVMHRNHEKFEVFNSPIIRKGIHRTVKFLVVPSPGKGECSRGDILVVPCNEGF